MGPEGVVLAGIATASVIRRPVAAIIIAFSTVTGVRGVFRVSALAAALERQGARPARRPFLSRHRHRGVCKRGVKDACR